MKIPFLLGRIVFGGFFLYNGINHLVQRKSLAQYAKSKKVPAADVAVPASGVALIIVAVPASGVALIIGGSSVLLGIKPKWGALAIMGFLASVSPAMHDFWKAEDPNQRMNDMINFSKNLALLGAALALMAVEEPWPASVPVAQPQERRYAEDIAAA